MPKSQVNENIQKAKNDFFAWRERFVHQILEPENLPEDQKQRQAEVDKAFDMDFDCITDFATKDKTLDDNLNNLLKEQHEKQYNEVLIDNSNERIIGEVHRMPGRYFCYYCLVNGIKESEMMELSKDNPSKEVLNKVRSKIDDFYDLALKEDPEKVVDFYVKLAELSEKKLPQFASLEDEKQGIRSLFDDLILYNGGQSIFSQSLCISNTHIPKHKKATIDAVNKILKTKGKSYTLEQAMIPMLYVNYPNQEIKKVYDEKKEENRAFRHQSLSLLALVESDMMKQMLYDPKGQGTPDKILGNIKTDPQALHDMDMMFVQQHIDVIDPKQYSDSASYDPHYDVAELEAEFSNHCHRVMGISSPSKEYEAIRKDLENIGKNEKLIHQAEEKGEKTLAICILEKTKSLYAKLQKDAEVYLKMKKPDSETSTYRYQLAFRAQEVADKNSEKIDSYIVLERNKYNFKMQKENSFVIGSKANLQKYIQELSQDMTEGSGFSIGQFAHIQAAAILLNLKESEYKNASRKVFDQLVEGYKNSPEYQKLAEKIPEGTKIKSISDLNRQLAKEKNALSNRQDNKKDNKKKNDKKRNNDKQILIDEF